MALPFGLWSTTAICLGGWITYRIYCCLKHIRALSCISGPTNTSCIWGDTFDLRQAPVGTKYRQWRKQYGTTYLIHEPLMEPVLVLGDAVGAAHVLKNTSIYWRPDIDKSVLTLWFGESLLSTEAETHARRRKRLNPAFTPQSVMKVSPIFFDLAHHLQADWDDRLGPEGTAIIDVSEALHTFSMNAISMTMFAHNVATSSSSTSVSKLLYNITNGPSDSDAMLNRIAAVVIATFPRLLSLPNPMKHWADMLRTELRKIAEEVWDAAERDDIVGGMDARVLKVLNEAESGQATTSRDDAVAEIIGLLFAGSETVANVMGEFLYELAQQPVVQDKLRDELMSFEIKHGRVPSYTELVSANKAGLHYFEAVTMETMRCKAVLMDISRKATTEDVIPLASPMASTGQSSIRVNPGQLISIPVRDGINVDPLIWGEDAEVFRPERWFEEGVGERGIGPGGILTFGDGGKACIGRAFALAEFKARLPPYL